MKKTILVSLALLLAICVSAQDYTFSQFYNLPMMRNPGLAGVFTGNIRIQSVFRNQWQQVTVPFQTSALSAEVKTANDQFTLGLQLTHDQAGDSKLKRIQALPSISYHQYIREDLMITAGFMGGLVSSQFDPSKLTWDDQFVGGQFNASNPTAQIITNTGSNYWDFGAGASILGDLGGYGKWYAGAAVYHFHKPKTDISQSEFSRLAPRYMLNMGLNAYTSDIGTFSLYADYLQQGGHRQLMAGMYYTHDLVQYDEDEKISLSLGAMYRWRDAIIPVASLHWYEWNIGLSYDVNVSELKTASQYRGGWEFTLGYRGFLSKRNGYSQKVQCFERL
jgi:type IX secretion system PorP/SprF family membrane protein